MFEHRGNEASPLYYLRIAARILSVLGIALILLFMIGEGFDTSKIELKEWVGFLFFPVGLVVGLVIAWRNEGLGGIVSVVSLFAFYLVYGLILNGRFWQGWAFVVFAIPSFLFLLYSRLSVSGNDRFGRI